MRKFDWRTVALLRPEDGYTTSDTHVGYKIVMADKYFLWLYKVSGVEIDVDSSWRKSGSWHMFASSADDTIVERIIAILAIELFDVSLHYGYFPTFG